jgi:hypothetical protein
MTSINIDAVPLRSPDFRMKQKKVPIEEIALASECFEPDYDSSLEALTRKLQEEARKEKEKKDRQDLEARLAPGFAPMRQYVGERECGQSHSDYFDEQCEQLKKQLKYAWDRIAELTAKLKEHHVIVHIAKREDLTEPITFESKEMTEDQAVGKRCGKGYAWVAQWLDAKLYYARRVLFELKQLFLKEAKETPVYPEEKIVCVRLLERKTPAASAQSKKRVKAGPVRGRGTARRARP